MSNWIPLWRAMFAASDAALEAAGDLEAHQIDPLIAAAQLEAVRDWLFPDGRPPQPWSVAEFSIWSRLGEAIGEARQMTICDNTSTTAPLPGHDDGIGGEASAPPTVFSQ